MRTFAIIGLLAATMMTPSAMAAEIQTHNKVSISVADAAQASRDDRRGGRSEARGKRRGGGGEMRGQRARSSEGRNYREGRRDGAQRAQQNYQRAERRDERRDGYREQRAYRDGRQDQRQVSQHRRGDNRFEYRGQRYDNWNNNWRGDRRYNWRDHRQSNRHAYHPGRYYAPSRGRGYSRLSIGFTLGSPYYASNYWISDPWSYRLPSVYGPYRWVRYYDDVLLIDVRSGRVVDVEHNFFW
jgi:Ni/Co efflux regulator RcnB